MDKNTSTEKDIFPENTMPEQEKRDFLKQPRQQQQQQQPRQRYL